MQIYVITITRLKLLSSAVSGVCVCAYVHSYGIQYNSPSQSLVNRCLCGAEAGKMGVFRMMSFPYALTVAVESSCRARMMDKSFGGRQYEC